MFLDNFLLLCPLKGYKWLLHCHIVFFWGITLPEMFSYILSFSNSLKISLIVIFVKRKFPHFVPRFCFHVFSQPFSSVNLINVSSRNLPKVTYFGWFKCDWKMNLQYNMYNNKCFFSLKICYSLFLNRSSHVIDVSDPTKLRPRQQSWKQSKQRSRWSLWEWNSLVKYLEQCLYWK